MSYDFDYFSGRDLHCPVKPKRPVLGPNPHPDDARAWADAMEAYEPKMAEYKLRYEEYTRSINGRYYELKTRLRDDHVITDAQMHLLWGKAYEDGHSEGLHRVVALFEELYDLATKFAALEG